MSSFQPSVLNSFMFLFQSYLMVLCLTLFHMSGLNYSIESIFLERRRKIHAVHFYRSFSVDYLGVSFLPLVCFVLEKTLVFNICVLFGLLLL